MAEASAAEAKAESCSIFKSSLKIELNEKAISLYREADRLSYKTCNFSEKIDYLCGKLNAISDYQNRITFLNNEIAEKKKLWGKQNDIFREEERKRVEQETKKTREKSAYEREYERKQEELKSEIHQNLLEIGQEVSISEFQSLTRFNVENGFSNQQISRVFNILHKEGLVTKVIKKKRSYFEAIKVGEGNEANNQGIAYKAVFEKYFLKAIGTYDNPVSLDVFISNADAPIAMLSPQRLSEIIADLVEGGILEETNIDGTTYYFAKKK